MCLLPSAAGGRHQATALFAAVARCCQAQLLTRPTSLRLVLDEAAAADDTPSLAQQREAAVSNSASSSRALVPCQRAGTQTTRFPLYTASWHHRNSRESNILTGRCLVSTSTESSDAQGEGDKPVDREGPLRLYNKGIQEGMYRRDTRQANTVMKLQHLFDQLSGHVQRPNMGRRRKSGLTLVDHVHSAAPAAAPAQPKTSWWRSVVSDLVSGDSEGEAEQHGASRHTVQGLYMYGGVGCGKTMLMDLFVSAAPAEFKVVRTHFHDFMLGVHAKLRQYKSHQDPLLQVADKLAQTCRVLAMDEFFVTDVADAMILNRLFSRLWDRGVILVATSNRAPDKLYEGGLQRYLFMPFIQRLKVECDSHDMASPTDYRRLAQHQRGLYFVTASRNEDLYEDFIELADDVQPKSRSIEVMMGRHLEVPMAAGKLCMFSFSDLCSKAVAAADYLAVAQNFHTLALSGVPVFRGANRSEGYRFVTLIDIMYEHRVRMLMSAEAMPFELFEDILTQQEAAEKPQLLKGRDVVVDDNLGFAKDRTISRMTEMQSLEYLLAHAKAYAPENVLALQEARAKAMHAGAA